VSKAHAYEPDINPTYQEMANHYQVAVIPARKQKPKDKAKVEVGVQIVERWILARLRNHTFFALAELNQAIRELLAQLNSRPFQKLPGTRHSLFQELDKPALQSLPSTPYEYAEHKKVRVNLDYHVDVDRHYYSVPHQLVHKQLLARVTDTVVECFYKDKRVASHIRAKQKGGYTTVKEHMPKAHKEYAKWTPERILRWAETMGPNVAMVIATILKSRPVPQQGFRSCLGILRLGQSYGEQRLEKACIRALHIASLQLQEHRVHTQVRSGSAGFTRKVVRAPGPFA
jgi:transposase